RAIVNIFYDNIEYSGEKARRVLGFTPAFTREESIRRTVAWYRENNLLQAARKRPGTHKEAAWNA
ncbi:MAG: hypothetical protein RRA94_15025, partial [Bacteroidota bacterium]|nr:hypothetical protein [Bacteroidota bacterium]